MFVFVKLQCGSIVRWHNVYRPICYLYDVFNGHQSAVGLLFDSSLNAVS